MTLALFTVALCPYEGHACMYALRGLKSPTALSFGTDLCALADRYQDLRAAFDRLGLDADDLRAVQGPRFIRYDEYFGPDARKHGIDPNFFYNPAPKTWQQWERAQDYVKNKTLHDQARLHVEVSENLVKALHSVALEGLPLDSTQYRTYNFIGHQLERAVAVRFGGVNKICYASGGGPCVSLLKWRFYPCYEDMTLQEQWLADQKRDLEIPENLDYRFSKTSDGKAMDFHCGAFTYPPHEQLASRIQEWAAEINSETADWFNSVAQVDPMTTIARAQRWFIAIHPFTDGNGRTSRFVMDYLAGSLGLPAPVFKDMDEDVVLAEDDWTRQSCAA